MKKYLFLVAIVLLLLLSVTQASALEKRVNITAGTIVNVSGSLQLQSVLVDGTPYLCVNNICTASVSYDCPTCPVCPTINYTDLQVNLSSYISASQEKIIKSIIEHNSSPDFKRADIEAMLADDDEAGKIEDLIRNTIMVTDNEMKNMTAEKDYWEKEWLNLNSTYTIQTHELKAMKADNERLGGYMKWVILSVFAMMGFVVVFLKLDLLGGLRDISSRILKSREGFLPGERELRELDERNKKLSLAVERRKKLRETKALEEELKGMGIGSLESGEELLVDIIPSPAIKSNIPLLIIPKSDKKKVVAETEDEQGAEIKVSELVATPSSRNEIADIVREFIKSKSGHSYITKELYEYCKKEKGITDETAISSEASKARSEIAKLEGGSWEKPKWIYSDGKRTTYHEYSSESNIEEEEHGGIDE